jgi:glycosyltransferase involved in cell wall biosynthesis
MNILYINRGMGVGGVEKCIIELTRLFMNDNKIVVASMGGELVKELMDMGIKHYKIINTDSKNILDILRNVKIINKIVKEEKINIIHSHHRMTTLLAKVVSKITKVPIIHTQHLCIDDKFKFTKMTLEGVSIITVSNGAKEALVNKCDLDESRITTIYNTVNIENANEEIDKILLKLKAENRFVIAQISRLVDYKGVYDFLNIAKSINKEGSNIRFILIGDGEEKENIRNFIKKNALDDFVFILGNKDNVINQLKCINLVLLCSYIEGLPLTPLEAFSQGVPVIATNIPGTKEEIENGINGYLVEMKDIDGFKEKIMNIYQNKEKYIMMKKRCVEIFNRKFNSEIYFNSHLDVYKANLKNSRFMK